MKVCREMLPLWSPMTGARGRPRNLLWPGAVVPYTLSSRYTSEQLRMIYQAMKHWEDNTCIRFRPRTSRDFTYVNFFPAGTGCCASYVGRLGYGQQGISIDPKCFAFRTIVHEIGHAVGFWHEQSRPDRDQYVNILRQNIIQGFESNFDKKPSSAVDSQGVGYDYNSIMHYNRNFFSRNYNVDTIQAKDPGIVVGRAVQLSQYDILQANLLYGCAKKHHLEKNRLIGRLTAASGSFQSPGYPNFQHNTDCGWIIKIPDSSGYYLEITFMPVRMEDSTNCSKDFIQVFEDVNRQNSKGKVCSHWFFYSFSTNGEAFVHYHTDSNNRYTEQGFRATYRSRARNECWRCSHTCTNTIGSYTCTCPTGFYLSADRHTCFDDNECALDNGGCDHKCVNRAGSFQCECKPGYILQSDGKTCRTQMTQH